VTLLDRAALAIGDEQPTVPATAMATGPATDPATATHPVTVPVTVTARAGAFGLNLQRKQHRTSLAVKVLTWPYALLRFFLPAPSEGAELARVPKCSSL
jgi:hypothetical protein